MPAAVAIPAVLGAVGVGGSIFSGITGAKAATSAAQIQAQAAKEAGQRAIDAANLVNPQITSAAGAAGSNALDAAKTAASGVTAASQTATAGVNDATTAANKLLSPYTKTGEEANANLSAGLAEGGQFNKIPTAADIKMDPGFQARLQAGQTVLERSAAARGGAASGTALQDLNNYAQTNASAEFDKAYQRFLDTRKQNFDFSNIVAGRGSDVAGTEGQNLIGAGKYAGDKAYNAAEYSGDANTKATQYAGDKTYNAAVATGNNTINATGIQGDYLTQGANATAAGQVGRANAITGAISSGVGALGSAAGIYNALKYPNRPTVQTPSIYTNGH